MSSVEVKEENPHIVIDEVWDLAEAHYNEVEEKASKIPFSLDKDLLHNMADLDLLYIVTARDMLGKMVGYFANMVSPDVITSKMVSKELGIYLDPFYRKSDIFPRMVEEVEKGAKARGAYSQVLAFKVGNDNGVAERIGYEKTETLYQKLLED